MNLKIPVALGVALLATASAYADADISGTVFNRSTAEPLDFANVVLVDPATDTPLPVMAVTGADGSFTLAGVPAGTYIVRVSMTGSVGQERTVTVGDAAVDLGRIELAPDAQLLQEVVITGQRGQMTVGGEHRLFNVSSNIASSGASAAELLAAVPSVDVNADGDISLRGNSDVMVWINGRQMGMNDDNRAAMLRQIPAEAIESIEVMTNPSARHSTEGTAGIINIRLKDDGRHGLYGSAEANADTRGNANAHFHVNYNEGHFETFAALGLKSEHNPGGVTSRRNYSTGSWLNSDGRNKKNENSVFLRLGTNYKPNERNTFYISAIGTVGHKWGHTNTTHRADLPGMWAENIENSRERGNTRGANILAGYRHSFGEDHSIEASASYNIWRGSDNNKFHELATAAGGESQSLWQSQHQDVKISNWEATLDYTVSLTAWLRLEAGYKGNYNRENSPASYSSGPTADDQRPLNNLYNRFKYDTDISAFYVNFGGSHAGFTYSAGLRGEAWQIRSRSLAYGQTDADVPLFSDNNFALFPSAMIGWRFRDNNELKLNYSRRIHRPFGPQLNTFENISDPSEVHLGNPTLLPEYSNAVELTYVRTWTAHTLSAAAYVRSNTDMISHVSFLAPMASDPTMNTMYYGHANVGNMVNTGLELISRNILFERLTLTTTLNLYNSHLKAWKADYPLHDEYYAVHGARQNRFVWDIRCMASVRLPWDLTFQATGRYNSRRVAAQGIVEDDWDVEAGIRKSLGAWSFSLICKDIFDSKKTHNILYGNGYVQSISKWHGGRALRLSVAYTFGKTHSHDHEHAPHNDVDTGGYGEEHHH